jgi:hypothetical protein
MTDFISGDELLAGRLPGRRANMLLFAIQNRTAQLVARSRQATALTLTAESAEARERAFLSALSEGRNLPARPTVQDLERYAPEWRDLVPADPAIRAAALRLLGMRPSERGDWIVAIYGSAPAEARVALLAYEGVERRLPVESGLYAFMTRVATEPEPTMTRPRFE